MGKFFQTQEGRFTDFAYEPNLNLKLALAEKQVQSAYMKDKLLADTPDINIDHIAYDKDFVADKKDYYENKIQTLTQNIFKDKENKNKYLSEIKEVKREMDKDFTSGEISTIQEQAKTYRTYEEGLGQLTNPVDREAYTKRFQNYINSNKGARDEGKFGESFVPGEMFKTEDYWNDFVASNSFKNLGINANSVITQGVGKKWLVKNENGTSAELSEDSIRNAYKGYVNSLPNVKGRARAGAELFEEDNWLDAQGELRFDAEGKLGKAFNQGVSSYAYKKTIDSRTLTTNPYGVIEEQSKIASRARMYDNRAKAAGIMSGSKTASFIAEQEARTIMDWKDKKIGELKEKFGMATLKGRSFKHLLDHVESVKDTLSERAYVGLSTDLKLLDEKFQEGIEASYAPLQKSYGFNDEQVINFKTQLNDFVDKKGYNVDGLLDAQSFPEEITSVLVANSVNLDTPVSVDNLQTYLMNSGVTVSILPESSTPSLLDSNNKYNTIQTSVQFTYNTSDSPATMADKSIGKAATEATAGVNAVFTTDFYIPMTEISGDGTNLLPKNYSTINR